MNTVPQTRSSTTNNRAITTSTSGSTLADVLERVLDKGIVIAGDISVSVGSTELLSIRIRLLISSVDKAREIGINWWESDPYLNAQAQATLNSSAKEVTQLQEKIELLEAELRSLRAALPDQVTPNRTEQPSAVESPPPPKQAPITAALKQAATTSTSNLQSKSAHPTLLEQDQALNLDALTLNALIDEFDS